MQSYWNPSNPLHPRSSLLSQLEKFGSPGCIFIMYFIVTSNIITTIWSLISLCSQKPPKKNRITVLFFVFCIEMVKRTLKVRLQWLSVCVKKCWLLPICPMISYPSIHNTIIHHQLPVNRANRVSLVQSPMMGT